MKLRIFLSAILILVILVSVPFAIAFFDSQQLIVYSVYALLLFSYVLIYFFGGVVKFIIYTIYALIIILLLNLFSDYHQSIIIIGGLAFIVNPLANFEMFLDKKINDGQTLPLRISIPSKYRPYREYYKNMRDYIKLPQTRKLYVKKSYLRLRQITTLILLFTSIYLLINEMRNLVIDLTNYDPNKLLIFYTVFVLFYLTFRLHKKGFTSFFRVAGFFLVFPFFYLVLISNIVFRLKISLLIAIIVFGLIYTIYEIVGIIKRVAYNAYQYYDSELQMEVFANDFYEPLVYSDTYYLVSTFKIEIPLKEFHKNLDDVIIRANFLKTIITAYTYDGTHVYLYTDNYYKSVKKPLKLQSYLEYKFKNKVYESSLLDPSKELYENTFSHKDSYIVARAVNLAELLEEFQIESNIVVRILLNFKSLELMRKMAKEFPIGRVKSLDSETGFVGFVQLNLVNQSYLIESKVREVLLSRLIYQAQYIRVLVFYLE